MYSMWPYFLQRVYKSIRTPDGLCYICKRPVTATVTNFALAGLDVEKIPQTHAQTQSSSKRKKEEIEEHPKHHLIFGRLKKMTYRLLSKI